MRTLQVTFKVDCKERCREVKFGNYTSDGTALFAFSAEWLLGGGDAFIEGPGAEVCLYNATYSVCMLRRSRIFSNIIKWFRQRLAIIASYAHMLSR